MIRQLQGHISQEQINAITRIIVFQYQAYKQITQRDDYQRVFADEYQPHKRQHSVSWAISSGFRSNTTVVNGFNIECLHYGKGHTRPQLQNERLIIHILNHTTHFNADYLKEYYTRNKLEGDSEQLYCYFKFVVDHQQLRRLSLCFPDENGIVIEEEMLLNNQEIKALVA